MSRLVISCADQASIFHSRFVRRISVLVLAAVVAGDGRRSSTAKATASSMVIVRPRSYASS